jgi:isochorismate synthase
MDDASAASPQAGPLLLGGFSFDPLHAASPLWAGFPDARLILPERMLHIRDGAAWLTTNTVVEPEHSAQSQKPRDRPTRAHRRPPPAALQHNQVPVTGGVTGDVTPSVIWRTLVGSIARGIRNGQLGVEKVVLARAQHVHLGERFEPHTALRNLARNYPSCTVFAIAHAEACFLGATPERLISLRDGTASAMALAGSFPRGATPAEDELLAEQLSRSSKERAEHAVVVGALRDGLSQVCTRIIADAQPRIQKLPNLQHLLTPIRGQVAPGRGVLDIVERLHPTPAVGGFPRGRALELIRAYEALDRGWYAGPIGWLDRAGEGEFAVGIRSALVRGDSATLFAGCGIVADSNPAAEYAESCWKLQPMLTALGVEA